MEDLIKNISWTVKYRPETMEDLILPDRVSKKFTDGLYQDMLLYGSPGTGKTSTAKCLCNTYGYNMKYINASSETSVDVIREQIYNFCSTQPLDPSLKNKMKVVILDEIDGASDQFFKALKAEMERFSKNTKFVATTNYVNKLPEAVLSRFENINFDFTKEEEKELIKKYFVRLWEICKKEGVTIEKQALVELIKRKFPDMRSILKSIQGYSRENSGTITLEDVKKFNSVYRDVYELIFSDASPVDNYKFLVANYSNSVDDILNTLGNDFIEYVEQEQPSAVKHIPDIIISVAKHQAEKPLVIDPAVTMLSAVFSIQNIVHK